MFTNDRQVKLGIVAVSRDCFPKSLSLKRREAVVAECSKLGITIFESKVILENERDAIAALSEVKAAGVDALCVYLGNFGPEGPETMLAAKFGGPVMFAAAAEETQNDLIDGRGDAFCGMLNASYNLNLRNIKAYIPEYPVGTAAEVASMIADFSAIAKIQLALKKLKIFSFGPRPHDFLACNAPIKGLFDLGVELQENSELDLYEAYIKHNDDKRIPEVVADMEAELTAAGNKYPGVLTRLAQYELTLLDWAEQNLGASEHFIFANKCWPAFQTTFHFVPCYVNSRLASRGIPVACETDIYGALSEYILYLATGTVPTLLDINNTVPRDKYDQYKGIIGGYKPTDLFMGFHCGNTANCLLKSGKMAYQLIMKRALEPDSEPNISRGTLEGDLAPSPVTLFRLQCNADTSLSAYIAEGEVLDVPSSSFGAIGVIAVPEMARFYRYVLLEKHYPHHAGVGFAKVGHILFELLNQIGITDVGYNKPAGTLYPAENPFSK
jgi:L-fucose isomerase and related proteins